MHFIDVGFKQSGSKENNIYHFETIFYGLTDYDQEIDLYKWDEVINNNISKCMENAIHNLDAKSFQNLAKIVAIKSKFGYFDDDISFLNKLAVSERYVKTKSKRKKYAKK